jgi:hypothetical protein
LSLDAIPFTGDHEHLGREGQKTTAYQYLVRDAHMSALLSTLRSDLDRFKMLIAPRCSSKMLTLSTLINNNIISVLLLFWSNVPKFLRMVAEAARIGRLDNFDQARAQKFSECGAERV